MALRTGAGRRSRFAKADPRRHMEDPRGGPRRSGVVARAPERAFRAAAGRVYASLPRDTKLPAGAAAELSRVRGPRARRVHAPLPDRIRAPGATSHRWFPAASATTGRAAATRAAARRVHAT